MLRFGIIMLATAGGLVGCASQKPVTQAPPAPKIYTARAASALAFEPIATQSWPADAFARTGRENSVFMGYESQVTDYYYSRTSDRQHSGQPDRVDRDSFSTRTSVTSR